MTTAIIAKHRLRQQNRGHRGTVRERGGQGCQALSGTLNVQLLIMLLTWTFPISVGGQDLRNKHCLVSSVGSGFISLPIETIQAKLIKNCPPLNMMRKQNLGIFFIFFKDIFRGIGGVCRRKNPKT